MLNSKLYCCGLEDYLILGGDFNCAGAEFLDRNHAEPHPASQHTRKQLVYSHGLVDVWRRMHADCRKYTWSHLREDGISLARLDRFYCFKHHFNVFKDCRIVPVGFTDHSLVLCDVFFKNVLPKSAYWHFNSFLISDKGFKEALSYFLCVFRDRKSEFDSLRQWWDHGKVQLKLLCQQDTLSVTQHMCSSMKDLESEIKDLEALSYSTGNRGHIEVLNSKKMALANLLDSRVQGALVQSRVQNIAGMDAPSSFFFGLKRKHGQRKMVHTLLSDAGQELTEPGQNRSRAVQFFSSLYSSEYEENRELEEEFCGGLPQVSDDTNTELSRPFQLEELAATLCSMQGRKAPGIDGLTVEFYKEYWDILGPDLLHVLNESLAGGSLPLSCRRAVVTPLPKKGNRQEIKNWCPVLLCVDYKILSKA